jgi:hypothetical protein
MREFGRSVTHLVPLGEKGEHDLGGTSCWCIPFVWEDGDGELVVSHNSRGWEEVVEGVRRN